MRVRLYSSEDSMVQALALDNGVLIRYGGDREMWCPGAVCSLSDDYDLVVTGGPTGLCMQLTGGFMEQYWRTYVPACRDVLELLFNSSIPEVQEQACGTADFIAEPDRRYGVRLNEVIEYRGYKGILDYDRETRTYVGMLLDVECYIYFAGDTAQETVEDFHRAVDLYCDIRASLLDLPEKSEKYRLDYIQGFRMGERLGLVGVVREHLQETGCTDITEGVRAMRKKNIPINRQNCRSKLEGMGLWQKLVKDEEAQEG